jgi:hypothetical protein
MRVARQSRFHRILESVPSLTHFFWSARMTSLRPIAAAAALTTLPAFAHDGHGLFGSHWHATDALGFVALAAVLALAVWFARK